jgi:hypothetical protein
VRVDNHLRDHGLISTNQLFEIAGEITLPVIDTTDWPLVLHSGALIIKCWLNQATVSCRQPEFPIMRYLFSGYISV